MKTGGTMNFLKRAGAILMVVAIFASSCNKYADDFEQINTKLDALAMTVGGVTTLTTDMAALKAQVTALQTAVAGMPTAAAQTAQFAAVKVETDKILVQIAAITTTLGNVATAGTATKTVVDQLKLDLAALTLKVTNDNAAMATKLTTLTTNDVAQTQQLNDLITANADLLTKVNAIQTDLAALALTGASTDAVTALTIGGLQAMLNAQKLQLEIILANTSMYNGDVTVTTPAEITFYLGKINQIGIVNGNVYINTSGFTAAQMVDVNKITSAITAVIGTTGNVTIVSTSVATVDFSNLTSVKGNYQIAGNLAGTTPGVDVNDIALSSVTGNVWLNYDGVYESTALSTVGGGLTLVDGGAAPVAPKVGTTGINFPIVVVTGGVSDGTNPAGTLVFPLATNVTLSGGVTNLTAASAVTVKLGAATYPTGLTILAVNATSVDLSTCTGASGPIAITTKAGATLNVDAFKTANVPVTVTGPTALTFPLWTGGVAAVLTSTTATDVNLAKHEWAAPAVLAAVTNLTLGNVNANVNLSSYGTLVTASVTGKSQTKWANTFAGVTATVNPNLTTLVVGGVMNTVSLIATAPLTDLFKLTSLTTSGAINSFTLTDADKLTGVALGHTQFVGELGFGATGSNLTVTNNALLTSLAPTALDKLNTLTVTGNAKLASFNFSSYQNLKDDASAIYVNISGNNGTAFTTASYSPAYPVTGSTPYQEAIIKSNSILSLKDYFAKAAIALVPLVAGTNIDINLNTPAAVPADVLSTSMIANKTALGAASLIVDATGGITKYTEMNLVVAE